MALRPLLIFFHGWATYRPIVFWVPYYGHFFPSVSPIFRSDSGLYGSYIFKEFPNIFEWFLNRFVFVIFWVPFRFSEKVFSSKFVDRFPLFFWIRFLIYLVRLRFSEKVLNSQFVERFPLFLSVSLFFGFVSGFQKKF